MSQNSVFSFGDKRLLFFFFFAEHLYYLRASLVAQILKNPPSMWETWVRKIPWRRERLPTLVFHGQRSLAGYSPRARQESDTTEQLSHTHTHTHTHNLCDKNHTRQNLHFSKKHNGKVCLKRNIWEWWLKHIWEDMYLLLKRSWSGHAGNLNAQWLRKAEITHIPLQWRRGNTCLCPFSQSLLSSHSLEI